MYLCPAVKITLHTIWINAWKRIIWNANESRGPTGVPSLWCVPFMLPNVSENFGSMFFIITSCDCAEVLMIAEEMLFLDWRRSTNDDLAFFVAKLGRFDVPNFVIKGGYKSANLLLKILWQTIKKNSEFRFINGATVPSPWSIMSLIKIFKLCISVACIHLIVPKYYVTLMLSENLQMTGVLMHFIRTWFFENFALNSREISGSGFCSFFASANFWIMFLVQTWSFANLFFARVKCQFYPVSLLSPVLCNKVSGDEFRQFTCVIFSTVPILMIYVCYVRCQFDISNYIFMKIFVVAQGDFIIILTSRRPYALLVSSILRLARFPC